MKYNFINNIKKFNRFITIIITIVICLNFNIKYVKAEENKVIKVGYPIIHGFTEINNKTYSGYAFEYLFEISKYTGWQYEFIEMSISEALDKLKTGEIDIVAGMIKDEETSKIFDFPELNSGYTYSVLSTLDSNTHISSSDYNSLSGIRVGYFDKSINKLSKLKEFFTNNNIKNVTFKSYSSTNPQALINALNNKEVDAIVTEDLLLNDSLKVLTKFDPLPHYFATTKGNTEIIEKLNTAINQINEYTPNFVSELYFKYFENNKDNSIILTKEEQEYLSKIDTLKAVYVDNFKPVQYYDKSTKREKGLIVDIGKLIAKKLGVSLELIKANSYDEAYKLIQQNNDYIALGVPAYYNTSRINNIIFTKSYLDLDMVKVYSKKSYSDNEKQILALPYGYGYNNLNSGYEIKYYETIEDCLKAVEKNEASLTYGNSYTISSYIADDYYSNLSIVPDSHSISASCALSENVNRTFFNILNKAIDSISSDDIKAIIYNNSTYFNNSVSFKSFFFGNLTLCLIVISIILTIIVLLVTIIVKMKFNKLTRNKNLLLSKSQTDQLSGLYNRATCEELVTCYLNTKNSSLYSSFIIMDIDYFKQVNDKFGHQYGDNLLKEFGQILKDSFSHTDILCRWGGDEFIVFMKDISKNNLQIVNEKLQCLCQLMNKNIEYNGVTQEISISVGAITINDPITFDELYKKADEVLYDVKRNGKNGFKIKQNF